MVNNYVWEYCSVLLILVDSILLYQEDGYLNVTILITRVWRE